MKSFVFVALALALVAVALAKSHKMADIEFAPLSDAMVQHVNSVQKDWVAGHNAHFKGKSLHWIKGLMGARMDGPKLPEKHIQPLKAIPDTFDSRTAWPSCESIQHVRDQGSCGSYVVPRLRNVV
jgi:cathepsin B